MATAGVASVPCKLWTCARPFHGLADRQQQPRLTAPLGLRAGGGQPEHDDRPTVLVTTVDIGGGRSDRIEIRKGDDPADAARKFCEQHQLPNAVLEPLTQHLLDNLRKTTPSTPIKQTADEFPAQVGQGAGIAMPYPITESSACKHVSTTNHACRYLA